MVIQQFKNYVNCTDPFHKLILYFPIFSFVLIALALIAAPASARPKKWHRRHVDNTANGNEIKDADNIFTQLSNDAGVVQTAPKADNDVASDNDSSSLNLSSLLNSQEDGPVSDFQKMVMEMLMDTIEKELDKAAKEVEKKKGEKL